MIIFFRIWTTFTKQCNKKLVVSIELKKLKKKSFRKFRQTEKKIFDNFKRINFEKKLILISTLWKQNH